MAFNCASRINATKYWLLVLSNLAGKTPCPILLPASTSRLRLLWVPQSGTVFLSAAETAGTPFYPPHSVPCTLHIGGALLRDSESGGVSDPLLWIALSSPSISICSVSPSPANTLGFPISWGKSSPPYPSKPHFKLCPYLERKLNEGRIFAHLCLE